MPKKKSILNLKFFETFSYLHTGSLEESSTLFLSHFPKFVVHNTENWRIETCEYIVIILATFRIHKWTDIHTFTSKVSKTLCYQV